jgi:hypothetical protein
MMSSEKEIERLNKEIESLKNERDRYINSWRMALKDGAIAKEDTINVARFDVVRILTYSLGHQIRKLCFNDSIVDEALKSEVKFTLLKLKELMNVEFEDGIFYYYSKTGTKSKVDGTDWSNIPTYNKEWMK